LILKLKTKNILKKLFDLLVKRVYISKINNNRKHIKFEIIFNYGFESKEIIKNFNKNKKFDNKSSSNIFLPNTSLLNDTNRSRS